MLSSTTKDGPLIHRNWPILVRVLWEGWEGLDIFINHISWLYAVEIVRKYFSEIGFWLHREYIDQVDFILRYDATKWISDMYLYYTSRKWHKIVPKPCRIFNSSHPKAALDFPFLSFTFCQQHVPFSFYSKSYLSHKNMISKRDSLFCMDMTIHQTPFLQPCL